MIGAKLKMGHVTLIKQLTVSYVVFLALPHCVNAII